MASLEFDVSASVLKMNFSNMVKSNSIYSVVIISTKNANTDEEDFFSYNRYPYFDTRTHGGGQSWGSSDAIDFQSQYRAICCLAICDTDGNTALLPLAIGIDRNTYKLFDFNTFSYNVCNINTTYHVTIPDNFYTFKTGLSQLVTSGNIKAAVYNGTTYPPGATIPLDPSVENITLVNQNYTLTMGNTQNMKNVQIDNTVYSDFPVTVNVEKNTVLQMSGKDDPVITVDYTNTGKPTVINTKV